MRVTPKSRHLVWLLKRRVRRRLIDADKALVRKFLSEPFPVYRFPVDGADEDQRKKQLIKRHKLHTKATKAREEALFALYAIPADWSPDLQWYWLARHLAGDFFRGCRELLLEPPRAGRPVREPTPKMQLFEKFRGYVEERRIEIPKAKDRRLAREFFKKHKADCNTAGFNNWLSFYNAMNGIRRARAGSQ